MTRRNQDGIKTGTVEALESKSRATDDVKAAKAETRAQAQLDQARRDEMRNARNEALLTIENENRKSEIIERAKCKEGILENGSSGLEGIDGQELLVELEQKEEVVNFITSFETSITTGFNAWSLPSFTGMARLPNQNNIINIGNRHREIVRIKGQSHLQKFSTLAECEEYCDQILVLLNPQIKALRRINFGDSHKKLIFELAYFKEVFDKFKTAIESYNQTRDTRNLQINYLSISRIRTK